MFRLFRGGKPLTPFVNAEAAGVADRFTPTPHVVDVSNRFEAAYWSNADACEIAMPGQVHRSPPNVTTSTEDCSEITVTDFLKKPPESRIERKCP
jgi:hypothetical protein